MFAEEDKILMKIAPVSDEEININQHFGRAPYYVMVIYQMNLSS